MYNPPEDMKRRLRQIKFMVGKILSDKDLAEAEHALLVLDDCVYELYALHFDEDRDTDEFAEEANDYLFTNCP